MCHRMCFAVHEAQECFFPTFENSDEGVFARSATLVLRSDACLRASAAVTVADVH
eukprot:NODE_26374_length_553_cov_2.384977.p4 GENE.NODE_26374_length_553_cov_2.384977~~NODE_26374_length_553_cov_2.384977.p4  ORF type:complete len:55 (+),score=7.19 NODE_26374_length_553_cov_2.384977:99-263(+)